MRIVTATHRDLAALVKKGTFRQDLFYRVNVVRIPIPPLRKRKEDIPLLVEHFISRFNRVQGKTVSGVSPEVMAFLMAHDFPGNVRELENLIEHAFVLCGKGRIETLHLPEQLMGGAAAAPCALPLNMSSAVQVAESQAIVEAIRRNNGNRLAAARELGMHKSSLFRKIKTLGIELPEQDGRHRIT